MDREDEPFPDRPFDTGDALAASAAIERWFATRPAIRDDSGEVLGAMRRALEIIRDKPVVRNDPLARRMLDEMAEAETMDEVSVVLERLDDRVRSLMRGTGKRAVAGQAEPARQRPVRTLLRL